MSIKELKCGYTKLTEFIVYCYIFIWLFSQSCINYCQIKSAKRTFFSRIKRKALELQLNAPFTSIWRSLLPQFEVSFYSFYFSSTSPFTSFLRSILLQFNVPFTSVWRSLLFQFDVDFYLNTSILQFDSHGLVFRFPGTLTSVSCFIILNLLYCLNPAILKVRKTWLWQGMKNQTRCHKTGPLVWSTQEKNVFLAFLLLKKRLLQFIHLAYGD